MKKIKVSIYGATGYVGMSLYQNLIYRDDIKILNLISSTKSFGKKYSDLVGCFNGLSEEFLNSSLNDEKIIKNSDIIFTALPYGEAIKISEIVKINKKILIDLGSDFRLKNKEQYKKWYNINHTAEKFLLESVYSIPELHRNKINNKTWLIANPGCYATSIQLALASLIKEGFINEKLIIIDSKSGVSGAGRNNKLFNHYCEENENLLSYNVGNHRHKPEMEIYLNEYTNKKIKLLFSTHLVPMSRGIYSSIYCKLSKFASEKNIRDCLEEKFYKEPFVKILKKNIFPNTKWVTGTNYCHINFILDKDTNRLILLSTIDNLIKGASGQAIQNMNILLGIKETKGLLRCPLFP